ncbi:MAG: HlyD family efflux transporter periplasmic adaptor subunit [Synechococcaceae bacterium WB8_1A_041]|nr:HlyD family efflux transporter periplasmic adaptor subunit [Synechococcaceae bacterium WB6_1A_059]NBY60540.1 HlyD family efflux transporter periplasmic adaptor subunit [Synechococcaceae bacterium LLD_019]NCU77132.1 HlyD family efflux transporter periplasmic adaptor subunit [Synechococcaceae bacterium WB7_1C_051]NCU90830.1 HlyD family efflux transporter periplasmic adaptor subunit [Synechococcaceae bacterium WB7_1B_046]NCY13637.1 HlyD family efflux transporter periplasmic adaptor subunit [Syn
MSNLVRRDPSDLQEIRLRPSPRWSKAVVWALIGTASFAFLFALLAKIDEVVVAQGDLEPAGAVKPIKAVQSAVVEEIFVKEGQVVEPGQPLIRFDTDKSQAQKSNVSRQLLIEQQRISEQANASRARLENLQAKRQSLISKRDSEKLSLLNQEDILRRLDYLTKQGGMGLVQYMQEKDKGQQMRSQIAQTEAAIRQTDAELDEVSSDLLKQRKESDRQLSDLERQRVEVKEQLQTELLKSPVRGQVFDLTPTSKGYAVAPNEPLLKIVPLDKLQAKVYVTSKDIGFVKVGQFSEVRLDSYPFTEFGSIKGRVKRISTDSLPPDEQNPQPRFPVLIKLDQQKLEKNGRSYALKSGETLSANLVLREKRVITLLTDVIDRAFDALKPIRSPTT